MILRVFSCMTTHGFEGHQVVSIEEVSEVVQRGMAEDLAQPVGRLRMLPEKSSLFQGLVLRFGGALWAPCCTLKRKNWGCFRLVYFSPEGGQSYLESRTCHALVTPGDPEAMCMEYGLTVR